MPWYMVPAMKELLALIRKHEGGTRGYNADLRNDDKWIVTSVSFDQVRAWGRSQVTNGGRVGGKEPSSAIGGYQFLTATLDWLKEDLKLKGTEIFDESLQDDLAVHLINAKRVPGALGRFARGSISIAKFGDLVAKEWASMPVLYSQQGGSRWVNRGQSYYAGDGLNAALTSASVVEAVLTRLQAQLAASVGNVPQAEELVVLPPSPLPDPPEDELEPEIDEEVVEEKKESKGIVIAIVIVLSIAAFIGGKVFGVI